MLADDSAEVTDSFRQRYRGWRYSFGYAACPALEDQTRLFIAVDPAPTGVGLTEELARDPKRSTSTSVVHRPETGYFIAR